MEKKGFAKLYLMVALCFALLGLLDIIFTLVKLEAVIFKSALGILAVVFFFFNITALPLLHHFKAERIYYLLPIYYLISYTLMTITGIIIGWFNLALNSLWVILIVVGALSSLFELIFSIYLLKKIVAEENKDWEEMDYGRPEEM